MKGKVKMISAIGTSGAAKGKLFTAKPDKSGRYVLNKKNNKISTGKPTNFAVNKVYAETLDEAAKLLATDEYLINLRSDDNRRALREYKKVEIERF